MCRKEAHAAATAADLQMLVNSNINQMQPLQYGRTFITFSAEKLKQSCT